MLKDRKKKERTTEIADGTTKDVERGGEEEWKRQWLNVVC